MVVVDERPNLFVHQCDSSTELFEYARELATRLGIVMPFGNGVFRVRLFNALQSDEEVEKCTAFFNNLLLRRSTLSELDRTAVLPEEIPKTHLELATAMAVRAKIIDLTPHAVLIRVDEGFGYHITTPEDGFTGTCLTGTELLNYCTDRGWVRQPRKGEST